MINNQNQIQKEDDAERKEMKWAQPFKPANEKNEQQLKMDQGHRQVESEAVSRDLNAEGELIKRTFCEPLLEFVGIWNVERSSGRRRTAV